LKDGLRIFKTKFCHYSIFVRSSNLENPHGTKSQKIVKKLTLTF